MTFLPTGIIQQFLDLLGATPTTLTGQYIVFVTMASCFVLCIVAFLTFIFKLLVYIRKG